MNSPLFRGRPAIITVLLTFLPLPLLTAAPLSLPGSTAYSVPDARAVRMDDERGVVKWDDPKQSVVWFGQFARAGEISCKVKIDLPKGGRSRLKLTIGGKSSTESISGKGEVTTVDFGSFPIPAPGYQRMVLENLNSAGEPAGRIEALEVDGAAMEGAHFNTDPRRNAASVHLIYPEPKGASINAFYGEAVAVEDPLHTYYMVCGFSRGYFGMQVNSEKERRIIFSVWDAGSGTNANDRSTVAEELHTTLLAKGEGVHAGVFGNEGTGGHSHLKYNWKTGSVQKFLVTVQPEGTTTDYTGYWFHPEENQWKLIASFHAPQDGKYLRGLYSFSENFSGENGHLLRKARFGNQWIRTADGAWSEITEASFGHDATGKAARLDRFMGVEDGWFFLSQGGFTDGFTDRGKSFTRPGGGPAPDLKLPTVP